MKRKSTTVNDVRYTYVALSELTVKTCGGYRLLDGDSMRDFLQSVTEMYRVLIKDNPFTDILLLLEGGYRMR